MFIQVDAITIAGMVIVDDCIHSDVGRCSALRAALNRPASLGSYT
jgi:hypothetical protein